MTGSKVVVAMDVAGRVFQVGQQAVRGVSLNRAGSVGLEVVRITDVRGERVFVNGNTAHVRYPGRLAIIG